MPIPWDAHELRTWLAHAPKGAVVILNSPEGREAPVTSMAFVRADEPGGPAVVLGTHFKAPPWGAWYWPPRVEDL